MNEQLPATDQQTVERLDAVEFETLTALHRDAMSSQDRVNVFSGFLAKKYRIRQGFDSIDISTGKIIRGNG